MKSVKAYAPDGEHVTIICPHCGIMRQGSLKRIRTFKHSFNVRCRCDQVFNVTLELRKSYRKKTFLLGTFERTARPGTKGGITVENLSLSGIGFTTNKKEQIKVDESLLLRFTLDDAHRTEIVRKGVVRHVHNGYVGCEFISGTASNKALGYYLMP